MTRTTDPDPIIATIGGRSSRGATAAWRQAPVSYQEVPERQSEYARALSQAVLDRVEAISPWRPFVTRVALRDDVSQYTLGRGGAPSGVDASQKVAGPSAQLSAYWLPRDHTAPTIPGDITWDSNLADAQPAELLVQTGLSNEDLMDSLEFTKIENGRPAKEGLRADPVIAKHLAEALVRAENVAFAAGAASNADPIRGLANIAGLSTFAAATTPYLDDLVSAIAKLRAAKRFVNAAFVSPGHFKLLRQAKGTTNAYLFDPAKPLVIAVDDLEVPVRVLDGIPDGASTVAYVGDFTHLVMTQRVMPNGLLVKADRSDHVDFATDAARFRAIERFDLTLVPNQGASVYKITGINAPAP